jgi:hypothetical protein
VELANGTVAMILKTDGLENSGLPHSSQRPSSRQPAAEVKRVKVALLHPFLHNRQVALIGSRLSVCSRVFHYQQRKSGQHIGGQH